jgi:hypothetical protein
MAKILKTFYIGSEVADKLKDENNQSALINKLLTEHYSMTKIVEVIPPRTINSDEKYDARELGIKTNFVLMWQDQNLTEEQAKMIAKQYLDLPRDIRDNNIYDFLIRIGIKVKGKKDENR